MQLGKRAAWPSGCEFGNFTVKIIMFIFVGGLRFAAMSSEQRPVVKCKLWNEESMRKAYEAVTMRGESVRRAATHYDVPKSTLHDRVEGKVSLGARSGPQRYLTNEEEECLVKF